MRQLVLSAVLALSCAPTAPLALASATATTPPSFAPSATAAPSAVTTATPEAIPARTPAGTFPTIDPGPVRNSGQKMIVRLDEPLPWSFGEGTGAPATNVASYALNGVSLAGSAMRCTTQIADGCTGLEIIPTVTLVNGVRYELTLEGRPLGTFVALGLVAATPHVISAKATQLTLTITFDRPMLHVGECGTYGWNFTTAGTMEYVRTAGTGFPSTLGSYSTTSAAYRDFFSAFVSQSDISADCRTVTLGSGWGAPAGTFDVTIAGVRDQDGNLVEPRTLAVVIDDESAPRLMFANVELQTVDRKVIRVAYSEAMDEEYVTDPERYYLNGQLVPAGTRIECELESCTWVRLTFAPSSFTYGASNTLTIVGVRDGAGKAMVPDITTSAPFQVF